jgi:hypothetical protein
MRAGLVPGVETENTLNDGSDVFGQKNGSHPSTISSRGMIVLCEVHTKCRTHGSYRPGQNHAALFRVGLRDIKIMFMSERLDLFYVLGVGPMGVGKLLAAQIHALPGRFLTHILEDRRKRFRRLATAEQKGYQDSLMRIRRAYKTGFREWDPLTPCQWNAFFRQ